MCRYISHVSVTNDSVNHSVSRVHSRPRTRVPEYRSAVSQNAGLGSRQDDAQNAREKDDRPVHDSATEVGFMNL